MLYMTEHGMIDLSYVQAKIDMEKNKELLKNHPYSIWRGTDDYWHTYLPTTNGRKPIKRKEEKDVEQIVISYWKDIKQNTFKNRFKIWIERQKACGRSDNTIYKYECNYARFFSGDPIEDLDVRNISEEEISLFIQRIFQRKKVPYKALKEMFGHIDGVMQKCIVDKIIEKNPCCYVDLPIFKQYCEQTKDKTSTQRTLSQDEKKVLLRKIHQKDSVVKCALELSLYTGMRVGELSALKWEDVDCDAKTLTICRSEKYNRKTKEYSVSTTKNDKVRIIPLTENMMAVLDKTKKLELRQGYISDFIFCGKNGRIHARTISDCARNNTMSHEFSSIKSIHAIRRTLNSNLKCMGVATPIAAALLGHTEKVNENNYTYDVSRIQDKLEFMEKAGKIG